MLAQRVTSVVAAVAVATTRAAPGQEGRSDRMGTVHPRLIAPAAAFTIMTARARLSGAPTGRGTSQRSGG